MKFRQVLPSLARHPALCVVLALVCLLSPFLLRGEIYVYRDAAHFYYPAFEWSAAEWAAGRVPLWNPRENLGAPVVGDVTSSVFYPGKLVFSLPFLSFGTRYMLYIAGHLGLAAAWSYFVARKWGASAEAAAICALSYACGGSVLAQVYNVVYLVSAAWLPLALFFAERMLAERSLRCAALFGAVLALMTLGGDPQTAYHAGMIAALYACLAPRLAWLPATRFSALMAGVPLPGQSANGGKPKERVPDQGRLPRRRLAGAFGIALARVAVSRPVLLLFAALAGLLLSAVQVWPAIESNRQSERAAFVRPRSIHEAWLYVRTYEAHHGDVPITQSGVLSEIGRGLAGEPRTGTHHAAVYDFSTSPWRLWELAWPNVSGTPFPENRRWIKALPAQGRDWTPSLYAGLLPLLLGLGSMRLRQGTPRERWLTYSCIVSLLAALGWYGLGWLTLEAQAAYLGSNEGLLSIGAPTGGLYWFFVVFLPGYVQFRYPSKWLVPAALALAMLAARGWDRWIAWESDEISPSGESRSLPRNSPGNSRSANRLRVVLCALGCLSAVLLLCALGTRPLFERLLAGQGDDDYFGPLNVVGSWQDVCLAFFHTALICGALWWVLGRISRRRLAGESGPSTRTRLWQWAALAITAAEVAFAQSRIVSTAPRDTWQAPSPVARAIADHLAAGEERKYRVFRGASDGWHAPSSAFGQGSNRQIAAARWERQTLAPRYHLLEREPALSLVESEVSSRPNSFAVFLHISRLNGYRRPDEIREPHKGAINAVAAKYLILPPNFSLPGHERLAEFDGAVLWHNPVAWPRAWVAHFVKAGESSLPGDPLSLDWSTTFATELLARSTEPLAVVEPAEAVPREMLARKLKPGEPVGETRYSPCSIVLDMPQRVEIEANLETAGLLVLGDTFDAGWNAATESERSGRVEPLEIVRVNRVMRGVFLPAGNHRVVFFYRPLSVYWGAAISALAWCLLLAILACWARRRRNFESATA